jgi:peroxiredoxin
MSRIMKSLALIFFLAIVSPGLAQKVGERAPAFKLAGASGPAVALKDFAGKSKVVLVFYRGYW